MPISNIQKNLANAKINLYLQVLNKREDNYHNINSLFYPIPLYDEIIISDSNNISNSINDNNKLNEEVEVICQPVLDFPMANNLVFKAAKMLNPYTNNRVSPKITLVKNIPIGAGLGGGSSDAAATLIALNKFWQLDINLETLHKMAAALGSDVPFFLYNTSAIVTERGNTIKPVDFSLQNWWLLLIFPNIYVSTPLAYQQLKRNRDINNYSKNYSKPIVELPALTNNTSTNIEILKKILVNDFEEVVFSKHPILREIKQKLLLLSDGLALMSGSGSSIFALFQTKAEVLKAAAEFISTNYFTYYCQL